MSKQDWSAYSKKAVLSNPKARDQLKHKLQLHVLHLELIRAKQSMILNDYPELDIIFPMIEKERLESEQLYDELRVYDKA